MYIVCTHLHFQCILYIVMTLHFKIVYNYCSAQDHAGLAAPCAFTEKVLFRMARQIASALVSIALIRSHSF